MTREEVLFLISKNPLLDMSKIPREYLHEPEFAHILVNNRHVNWFTLPKSISCNVDFVLNEVKNDPSHFRWLDIEMRQNKEICYQTLIQIKKPQDFLLEFSLIPPSYMTEDFVMDVILTNPIVLPLVNHIATNPIVLPMNFYEEWWQQIEVVMNLEGQDREERVYDLSKKAPVLVSYLPHDFIGLSLRVLAHVIQQGYADKIDELLKKRYPCLKKMVWVSMKLRQKDESMDSYLLKIKRRGEEWIKSF